MLEITSARTLIALLTVGRISGICLASAVFTCYLVKLLVTPFIDVRLESNPYREFATIAATSVIVAFISISLQITAGVFFPPLHPSQKRCTESPSLPPLPFQSRQVLLHYVN